MRRIGASANKEKIAADEALKNEIADLKKENKQLKAEIKKLKESVIQ